MEEVSRDLLNDLLVVYDHRSLRGALHEILFHPVQSAKTLLTAVGDCIAPGESMERLARLKLIAQAFGGIALSHGFRKREVRHIRCHFAHAPTTVGMYAAKQLGISFSFTGHANDLFQRRALLKRKLERAAFVACISHWHRSFYESILPDVSGKYLLIRCGVDVEKWVPEPIRSTSNRALNVFTVGRLVKKKGIDTLIRAIAKVARPAELTVIGDGPERKQLQSLAEAVAAHVPVRWLGAVDNAVVRQMMREADVFVLPCRTDTVGDRDGIPVVLMEAMACGVPVISGDLPAIRELVEHDESGLLVSGEDEGQLALQLDALTDERRNAFAMAARSRVQDEFSLSTTASRLDECLRRVLGS